MEIKFTNTDVIYDHLSEFEKGQSFIIKFLDKSNGVVFFDVFKLAIDCEGDKDIINSTLMSTLSDYLDDFGDIVIQAWEPIETEEKINQKDKDMFLERRKDDLFECSPSSFKNREEVLICFLNTDKEYFHRIVTFNEESFRLLSGELLKDYLDRYELKIDYWFRLWR